MALIPEEVIAQVVDRCDIVEIISSYIPLKRAGRNFKAQCPFHNEKTPSFLVNPDKQIFHCFGCGVGGNVVTFVMKQERMEFPEAIRLLAQKVNVVVPSDQQPQTPLTNKRHLIFKVNALAAGYFHRILLSDRSREAQQARDYLKKRKIDLQTVQQFQLGFAPNKWEGLLSYLREQGISLRLMEEAGLIIPREDGQGFYDRFRDRIIFPIFDTQGHCRAFGGRAFDPPSGEAEKISAKYINSPETIVYTKGHHLYGFHLAKQGILQEDAVVIVEGYTDCLTPYQQGIHHIVASLGTALTVEQIRLLHRYTKNLVMLFDADPAGEAAMMRSLDTLIEEGMNVKVTTLTPGQDPDSFIRQNGVEAFRQRIRQARDLFDYKLDILQKRYDAKSVEGKAKICSEILPTVHRFDNAILKAIYLKRLAQALAVPEEALMVELRKVGSSARDSLRTARRSDLSVLKQHRVVERSLLKLLLEEEHLIAPTRENTELSDFQDGRIREVISKIYEMFDQGKKINSRDLMNSFDDHELQQVVSELTTKEEMITGDKIKIHRDCLRRLKQDRLKFQRQTLLEEMRQAEISGDAVKLNELKEKFHQSIQTQKGEYRETNETIEFTR